MGPVRRQSAGDEHSNMRTSEDRDLFAKALKEIDIPITESIAANTVEEAMVQNRLATLSLCAPPTR
jgi:carbamoylphosphate synthase large subunit